MVAVCGGEISATKERHSQPRLRKFIGNDPAAGASTNYDCIHRSFAHSSDDQPSGLTLPRVGLGFWAKSRGLARKHVVSSYPTVGCFHHPAHLASGGTAFACAPSFSGNNRRQQADDSPTSINQRPVRFRSALLNAKTLGFTIGGTNGKPPCA